MENKDHQLKGSVMNGSAVETFNMGFTDVWTFSLSYVFSQSSFLNSLHLTEVFAD